MPSYKNNSPRRNPSSLFEGIQLTFGQQWYGFASAVEPAFRTESQDHTHETRYRRDKPKNIRISYAESFTHKVVDQGVYRFCYFYRTKQP